MVRDLVADAPAEIARLRGLGAVLDADPRSSHGLALAREGGHRRARVVHAGGDASGAEVDRTLVSAVLGSGAEVLECVIALDALTDASGRVVGLSVARVDPTGRLIPGVYVRVRWCWPPAVSARPGDDDQSVRRDRRRPGSGPAAAPSSAASSSVQFHPTVLWKAPGRAGARRWCPRPSVVKAPFWSTDPATASWPTSTRWATSLLVTSLPSRCTAGCATRRRARPTTSSWTRPD